VGVPSVLKQSSRSSARCSAGAVVAAELRAEGTPTVSAGSTYRSLRLERCRGPETGCGP